MKKQSILLTALLGLFLAVGMLYLSPVQGIFAQRAMAPERPRITKTVSSEPIDRSKYKAFAAAVAANERSLNSLSWPFGGKSQTGWAIYLPLIAQTVGAEIDGDPAEFAAALAKWQEEKGLEGNGIVSAATMQAFAGYWQSQRLGRSSLSGSDALVSAPIGDFWDSGRDPNMLQLERQTYSAYKRMIAAAAKDLGKELRFTASGELAPGEKFLRIVSAYRSPEYQAALRKREPGAGRVALAKNSPHFTGHALDIYVGGEPVTTKDPNRLIQVQTPAYKWLVKNASKFGFYPYFYEPWHWEYVPGR
jgi:zinc D-Ala-D-Ala carboxypeptidase